MEKRKTVRKSSTEAARQMYLYGEGDGVRIIDVRELSAKSGASDQTIRMRLPEWQRELEVALRDSSKLASPNILSLPEETLDKHKAQTAFILTRMEEVMAEIESLGPIISNLERIVDQISQMSEDSDKVINLFDRYLRLCMNRKSLIKLFTDLKRLWDEKVGLDSLKSIQEAAAKSVAVAQSKAPEAGDGGKVTETADGVFRLK